MVPGPAEHWGNPEQGKHPCPTEEPGAHGSVRTLAGDPLQARFATPALGATVGTRDGSSGPARSAVGTAVHATPTTFLKQQLVPGPLPDPNTRLLTEGSARPGQGTPHRPCVPPWAQQSGSPAGRA